MKRPRTRLHQSAFAQEQDDILRLLLYFSGIHKADLLSTCGYVTTTIQGRSRSVNKQRFYSFFGLTTCCSNSGHCGLGGSRSEMECKADRYCVTINVAALYLGSYCAHRCGRYVLCPCSENHQIPADTSPVA